MYDIIMIQVYLETNRTPDNSIPGPGQYNAQKPLGKEAKKKELKNEQLQIVS